MGKNLILLALTIYGCASVRTTAPPPSPRPHAAKQAATRLDWNEILAHESGAPSLSARTKALSGARVRMVGYVAHLDLPPSDGFFLSPTKVHGDEMGAGTGDLPPQSIRVFLRPIPAALPDVDGMVAVEGRLEVGPKEDQDGRLSHLRILVERDAESIPTGNQN